MPHPAAVKSQRRKPRANFAHYRRRYDRLGRFFAVKGMMPSCCTGASPVCPHNPIRFQRDVRKNELQSAHQLVCNDRAADPPQRQLAARDHAERISTGMRVSTASDNAAYWSIATSMRADNAALSAVSDSLGLSAATVDTEYTALTAVVGDKDRRPDQAPGAAGRSQDRRHRPHQDPGRHHQIQQQMKAPPMRRPSTA